jgi:hypothetical protein
MISGEDKELRFPYPAACGGEVHFDNGNSQLQIMSLAIGTRGCNRITAPRPLNPDSWYGKNKSADTYKYQNAKQYSFSHKKPPNF